MSANDVKLVMTDVNHACECCDGANPDIIKFWVVKGHDGFYAGPTDIVGMYAKTAVIRSGCNIGIHEA